MLLGERKEEELQTMCEKMDKAIEDNDTTFDLAEK
jgi:hypothetical protein